MTEQIHGTHFDQLRGNRGPAAEGIRTSIPRSVQTHLAIALGVEAVQRRQRVAFIRAAERYEHRSTIVTTNLAFSDWAKVFGGEKLTTAMLDRVGHHAYIFTTTGQSYRTHPRASANRVAAAPGRR